MADQSSNPKKAASTGGESDPSASLIDVPGTLARMGGDFSLMRDMAEFFIQDTPGLLRTIQEYRLGDEAVRAAHSLRGLASNFGAVSVMQLAGKIEAPEVASDEREHAINELAVLLPRVFAELQQRVISGV